MKTIFEGEKRNIAVLVKNSAGATVSLTSPQRRILAGDKTVVSDLAGATWDSENSKLYALFDSTAVGLTEPGNYFMQLRGVIGLEIYVFQITVHVKDLGP